MPAQTARLRQAIAQASPLDGGLPRAASIRLDRSGSGTPLAVLVVPFTSETGWAVLHRPAVTIVITDPDRSLVLPMQQLRELFSLTAAEARLAGDLLAGHEPRDIAEQQGRSIATVRTHIARLMAKAGVNRRAG